MKKNHTIFFGILSGILGILYFIIVYKFTINIPIADDFVAIQNFLLKYIQSSSIQEKLSLLFAQHDLHRILFARLIIILSYTFTGSLNYSVFIIIGNILLLCICFFMYKTASNKEFISIYILLIVLVFLNGQNFDTSTWAMVSIANIGIIFLVLSSIFCTLNTKRSLFYCGLALSAFTIFSNGNGMLIIPSITIGLFLLNRKKDLLFFLCISLISVFLYFTNFTGTNRTSFEFIGFVKGLPTIVSNFFMCVGIIFWIPSYKFLSFTIGLSCVFIFLFGFWKKWYKNNILLYAFLLFFYLSAAALAIAWFGGGEVVGALRYRIYFSPIIVLTLFLLINNLKKLKLVFIYSFFPFILAFSLLSTILYFTKEQKKYEWKKKASYNWYSGQTRLGLTTNAMDNFHDVERLGLYFIPKYHLSEYASTITDGKDNSFNDTESISYNIESIENKEGFLLIEGWGFLDNKSMNFKRIFVRLTNSEQSFIASTFCERRYDLDHDIPIDRKEHCGFFAAIDKSLIPSGTYMISICIKNVFGYGDSYNIKTDKNVTVQKHISAQQFTNPVIPGDFADPTVVRVGDK